MNQSKAKVFLLKICCTQSFLKLKKFVTSADDFFKLWQKIYLQEKSFFCNSHACYLIYMKIIKYLYTDLADLIGRKRILWFLDLSWNNSRQTVCTVRYYMLYKITILATDEIIPWRESGLSSLLPRRVFHTTVVQKSISF